MVPGAGFEPALEMGFKSIMSANSTNRALNGAAIGIRTRDLFLTKEALYLLSYDGNLEPNVGIEPTASALRVRRSAC